MKTLDDVFNETVEAGGIDFAQKNGDSASVFAGIDFPKRQVKSQALSLSEVESRPIPASKSDLTPQVLTMGMSLSTRSPDETARDNQIIQKSGMPAKAFDYMTPERATAVRALGDTPENFVKEFPLSSKVLSNSHVMAIAKDDVRSLQTLETVLGSLEPNEEDDAYGLDQDDNAGNTDFGLRRRLGGAASGLEAAVPAIAEGFDGLMLAGLDTLMEVLNIHGPTAQAMRDKIDSWRQKNADIKSNLTKEAQDAFDSELAKLAVSGVVSGGQNLLTLGTAAALSAAGAPITVGSMALGMMGLSAMGSAYGEAKDEGLNTALSVLHGLANGSLEVATEKLGLDSLIKMGKASGVKEMLRLGKNYLLGEHAGEQINTFLGDLESWMLIDSNKGKSFNDYLDERGRRAFETAVITTVGGGVQIGGAAAFNTALRASQAIAESETEELREKQAAGVRSQKLMNAITELTNNSKIAMRSPESMPQIVSEMIGEKVPFAYLPAEVLNQSGMEDLLLQSAPELSEEIESSKKSGSDIKIPIETMARLTQNESVNKAISQEVKFSPDELNARQAQERTAQLGADIEARLEQEMKATKATNPTRAEEVQKIASNISEQLIAAGMRREEAQANSQIHAAFFNTMAALVGVSPSSLAQKYGINIAQGVNEAPQNQIGPNMNQSPQERLDLLNKSREFDQKLKQWERGKGPVEFNLGKPSWVLQIFDASSKKSLTVRKDQFAHVLFSKNTVVTVGKKAIDGKHGIKSEELRGLLVGIQRPLAVFESSKGKAGSRSIVLLTELMRESSEHPELGLRNIVVPVRLTINRRGRITIDNSLRSAYEKDEIAQDWFGRLLGYEKTKGIEALRRYHRSNPSTASMSIPNEAIVYQNDTSVGDLYQSELSPIGAREGVFNQSAAPSDRLITVHNINEENLNKALDLGGFAVPSLGITKQAAPYTDFGDISLIGTKDMVDPKTGTPVFSQDAYTQTFPEPVWERSVNSEGAQKFKERVEDAAKESGFTDEPRRFIYDLQTAPNKDGVVKNLLVSKIGAYMFLKEKGIEVDVPKESRDYGYALKDKANEFRDEFEAWADKFAGHAFDAPMIEVKGKLKPITLENVVEAMRSNLVRNKEGTMTFGAGKIRAAAAKQFGSIEEIQSSRNLVTDSQTVNQQNTVTNEKLDSYRALAAKEYQGDSFDSFDEAMAALAKVAGLKSKPTEARVRSALKKKGFEPSDETVKLGVEILSDIKASMTDYFEAKPQRAVGLDEFRGAVVPERTSEATVRRLEDAGLTVVKYGDEEGARTRAIQDLTTRLNEKSGDVLYQSGGAQESKGVPLVRDGIVRKPDSATAKVVKISNGLVPNFERMQDFVSWVKEVLQTGGNITIQSTGQIASFPNANIKTSTKRARKRDHRESYLALREMIQNAEYDHCEPADDRHPNSVGQDIYYSALCMGGKLYSVKIKLDIVEPEVKERTDTLGDIKYKDHKLTEIEIAPTLYRTTPIKNGDHSQEAGANRGSVGSLSENVNLPHIQNRSPQETEIAPSLNAGFAHDSTGSFRQPDGAIDGISLGILRGNVNPSRIQNGALFQTQAGPRGAYSPSQRLITLFQSSDASTFIHESGHFFLDVMTDLANQPDAPQQLRRDMRTLMRWFGVKSLNDWNAMTLEEKREYHEKFARGFERYMREGKAPSIKLMRIFHSFMNWLKGVYSSAKQLNVKLTPGVRRVMDRMLATDQEIRTAKAVLGLANTYITRDQFPGTDEEWYEWEAKMKDEDDYAKARLTTQLLGERAFLEKKTAEYQAKFADEDKARQEAYAFYYKEAMDKLKEERIYKMRQRMLEEKENGNPIFPISRQDVDFLPKEQVEELDRIGVLYDDGYPLDVLSRQFGYENETEFVKDLIFVAGVPIELAAQESAENAVKKEFGYKMTPDKVRELARKSALNDLTLQRLSRELDLLNAGKRNPIILQAAKAWADEVVSKTAVKDLKPGLYSQAMRKYQRIYERSLAKGDAETAKEAKKNQLFNAAAMKAVNEAIDRVSSTIRDVNRMGIRYRKVLRKEMDAGYLDQILYLAGLYKIRDEHTPRESFDSFAQSMEEKGFPMGLVSSSLFDVSNVKNYKDMTVDEFTELETALSVLAFHGSRLRHYSLNQQKKTAELWAEAMVEDMVPSKKSQQGFKVEPQNSWICSLSEFLLSHRKFASLMREMGGLNENSAMMKLVARLNHCGDKETYMQQEAGRKLVELLDSIKGTKLTSQVYISNLGLKMSRAGMIAVALNSGNKINKERLTTNISEAAQAEILGKLTKSELEFVQNVWDFLENYWPEMEQLEKRTNGISPRKVEAEPLHVHTADGYDISLKGGYYPIVYDPGKSVASAEQQIKDLGTEMIRGANQASTTKQGHLISRMAKVNRSLLLDLSVIGQHLQKVTHDICFREWVQDTNRIFRNEDFKEAVVQNFGVKYYRALSDHLVAIAGGGNAMVNPALETLANKGANFLKGNVSFNAMALSATTAALQPLGITQSIQRVGAKWIFAAGLKMIVNPHGAFRECHEKSLMMRLRSDVLNADIADFNVLARKGKLGKMGRAYEKMAFAPMQYMQMLVDVPTWQAAYQKALAEGFEDGRAVEMADQAVLDSQGGGHNKDRSLVHRNHPFATMFYSYFSSMENLWAESLSQQNMKTIKGQFGFLRDFTLLLAIPTLGQALIFSALRGDDWDKDPEEWIKWVLQNIGGTALGMFVYARELSTLFSGFEYSGPPLARIINDAYRAARTLGSDNAETDSKAMAVMGLVADCMKIPFTQIRRSYNGWKAYIEGDTDMPTSILFGKPQE